MRLHTFGLIVMLALGILAAPLAAGAQPAGKVYRIGVLETTSATLNIPNLDAFRHGLRELGYVEAQNLVIEYRSADGRPERFPDLATELVRLPVDLILTRGTPAALAAKHATQGTIPVVITGAGDPVGSGLVASIARPGGNVTGLSALTTELYAKRVELLKELMPNLARLAGLFNMGNPVLPSQWTEVEMAARSLGVQPQLLDVRMPEEIGRAFDAAIRERADRARRGDRGPHAGASAPDRCPGGTAPAAGDVCRQGVCGRRGVDLLRRKLPGYVLPSSELCAQDLQRHKAR
jgi:ABC-type uncharacterized transport system substrate-binding protein